MFVIVSKINNLRCMKFSFLFFFAKKYYVANSLNIYIYDDGQFIYLLMIESDLMSLDLSRGRFCSCLFDFSTNVCSNGGDVFMKIHLRDEWYKRIKSTM